MALCYCFKGNKEFDWKFIDFWDTFRRKLLNELKKRRKLLLHIMSGFAVFLRYDYIIHRNIL